MSDQLREWLVWSREHSAWWRPNAAGYCTSALDAGRFTLDEANDHCNTRSRDPRKDDPEVMVHVDEAIPKTQTIESISATFARLESQNDALRAALEAVKADTAIHAGCGPTFALVCAALEANP